jgi:hypothetical protein
MKSLLVAGIWLLFSLALYSQCNVQLSAVLSNVSCYGTSTGSIDLKPTGGIEPYSFQWSNGATTEDLNNLSEGTYSVIVIDANACTASANYTITQPAQPPSITVQPLPQTDCYGNHVEFSVGVSGTVGTVIYQWQQKPPGLDFSDITGANGLILGIDNIGLNKQNVDSTEYRVLVTDDCGTITSDPALLRVNSITDIIPAVVNSTLCDGNSIFYEVFSHGNVILNGYEWSFNNGTGWNPLTDGIKYSGTGTSKLSVSAATAAQSGSYHVTVTFSTLNQPSGITTCVETSWSRERNLVVRDLFVSPVISASQQICKGIIPAALTALPASGGSGPGYNYQWQISPDGITWTNINGETTLSYAPSAMTSTSLFRIKATDGGLPYCGISYSLPVVITVNPLPVTSAIYHQ